MHIENIILRNIYEISHDAFFRARDCDVMLIVHTEKLRIQWEGQCGGRNSLHCDYVSSVGFPPLLGFPLYEASLFLVE
jgi:hypothetical protein